MFFQDKTLVRAKKKKKKKKTPKSQPDLLFGPDLLFTPDLLFAPPPRGSDSHVNFCPVFNFFNIRPFPGHPRANPAPKIIYLGTVGLNSPSRCPKIQKKMKNMVKIGYFGLRQNGRFLTKNGVSKKKSKKAQKIDEKSRLWTQFRRK